MTIHQQILLIALMAVCVMATRALPFILFSGKDRTPEFVGFLGKHLSSAVFGMLVIYCLKDLETTGPEKWIPYLPGILGCILLHLWRRNMLLTIAGGTILHMIMIRFLILP